MTADYTAFRSMRMKLAWLAHTRADCLFEISQLAQVTAERFATERIVSIRRLNKAIRFAVDNPIMIRIPKLNIESLKVVGFADASFANNHELSTQLGHIVFLTDEKGNAVPIDFKSHKARRVVRSAMAGEIIAFSDMFDVAVALAEELREIYQQEIALHLLTDSKALFDIISKGSRTSEKRMMLDIAAAREGFRDRIISEIGFVRSSENLADGLTKLTTLQLSTRAFYNAFEPANTSSIPPTGRQCELRNMSLTKLILQILLVESENQQKIHALFFSVCKFCWICKSTNKKCTSNYTCKFC